MKAFFSRHLTLKLMSLVMAYVVWAWVSSRSPGVRVVNINVDLRDTPDTVVQDFTPKQVRGRLEGDQTVINRITDGTRFRHVYRFQRGGPDQRLKILPEDVKGLPRWGVNLVITEGGDQRFAGTDPVQGPAGLHPFVREPPVGYVKTRLAVDPQAVVVRGPASRVQALTHITTREIDIRAQRRSFSSRVGLVLPDRHCQVEPETVRVTVDIAETSTIEGEGNP